MGIGYDVLKLAILIWFLAPFGYNASDVLFENVETIYIFIEDQFSIVGTNSPQHLPPEHDRADLQHALVQILDHLGILSEICGLPRPRLTEPNTQLCTVQNKTRT